MHTLPFVRPAAMTGAMRYRWTRRWALGRAFSCLVASSGCSSGGAGSDDTPRAGELGSSTGEPCPDQRATCIPAAVQAVLSAKCYACHGDPPTMFAPMALTTQEDFQGMHEAATEPNYVRAALRIRSSQQPMPPSRWPQLTAEERAVLLDWLDRGSPTGP